MIELGQLTVLVMVEAIIGLLLLSALLLFFAIRRKGRIRKAAHHLAERVQSDQAARTDRLKKLLGEDYGYTGAQLEQALHDITQVEMQLFQNLINGYMKDDQVHLQQVDVDEENLVLAYQALRPVQAEATSTAAEPEPAEDGEANVEDEMQRLRDENQRLSDELRVTMDTMGRMLNEYSSMFSGGSDKPLTRPASGTDEGQVATAEAGTEELTEKDEGDVEIPDLQVSDMGVEPMTSDPDALLESEEESSALDEEVSEIIDEVMEMADGMSNREEASEASTASVDISESLADELEQVDIELPDMGQTATSEEREDEATEKPETKEMPEAKTTSDSDAEEESGALEEEWARLLQEEAAKKGTPDDN